MVPKVPSLQSSRLASKNVIKEIHEIEMYKVEKISNTRAPSPRFRDQAVEDQGPRPTLASPKWQPPIKLLHAVGLVLETPPRQLRINTASTPHSKNNQKYCQSNECSIPWLVSDQTLTPCVEWEKNKATRATREYRTQVCSSHVSLR